MFSGVVKWIMSIVLLFSFILPSSPRIKPNHEAKPEDKITYIGKNPAYKACNGF